MAESQKTAAAGKTKEKSSLLDIDIDKDFLGSWKSMSMGDDGMDFDFGPPAQGKKKAFNFDKMDMDFSFDGDFGKLPSFKMDMSGLDISSPSVKSGNLKERSKEVSSGGENRSKKESFQFSFDFDEFADLDFGSKKTNIDEKSTTRKDKESLLDATTSGGSEEPVAKDVVASVGDDISSKHSVSRDVSIPKVDTQMDNIKDPDPRNEDGHLKSVIDESCLLKPVNAKELDIQREFSPEKIISCSLQEPVQESQSSDKRSSSESYAQQLTQDSYGQSSTDNVSTEATFSDMQEEESRTMVEVVSLNTGNEKRGNVTPVRESVHSRNLSESSMTPGMGNLAYGEVVDNKRNSDSFFKLHSDSKDGGTTIDELTSEKTRANVPVLSRFFNKQNGSQSELLKTSVSSTKLDSTGNKRVTTISNNPAVEKRDFGSRSVDSGTKLTDTSRSLPKVLSRDIPVQAENTETSHVKSLDKSRDCLNHDNIKPSNEPIRTIVAHNIGQRKEEIVSKGSDQNTEHTNALSGTTIDELASEKKRANVPVLSRFFNKQNGSQSELQKTSVSSTKLDSTGNKRVTTLSNNPAVEKREFGSRSVDYGTKLTDISRSSLPKVLSRDTPVQAENTETSQVKSLDKSRDCLNSDNIKPTSEPIRAIVTHNTGQRKEETVSKGSDQNTEHTNALRSAVHPSISIEQPNKNQSQNSLNSGLQVTRTTSTPNMRKLVKNNMISSTNAEIKRVSEVSTLRVSRVAEPKVKTLSSMLPKGSTIMKSKEIDKEFQGNMAFKENSSANIKTQSPSTPSLKRKTFEGSAEITQLTPLKRLSASPCSNTIRTSSERVIDEQVYNHSNNPNEKSPRLDLSHMEMDISSEMEKDDIFEKAEACSKELEDICNMLKKKHEEAKDILVRAIVNNNDLLMLNHPIYQDKLNMVQKFAAGLKLK